MENTNNNSLTNREKEVLSLLVLGLNNYAISERLCISNHTTKAHITSIYKKLGVSNRVQATVKAMLLEKDLHTVSES